MNCEHAFDIFKRLPSGNPLWITAVQGLVEAKKRMAHLALISPAEYFIYSLGNGIVAELLPDSQDLSGGKLTSNQESWSGSQASNHA
jgi:hypothetical protein